MEKQTIIELTCKKHVKIYRLSQLGLSKKEVAASLGTNVGHVYNVLKMYEKRPELVEKAINTPAK